MGQHVAWKPFYSVGNAAIDDQHKRLLTIVDDLYVAVQTGNVQTRVQSVLDRLADYTTVHFDYEERVMRECGYPRLEAHIVMHQEMRRRALEFRANPDAVAGHELLQFVKNWWVRHVQNQDKEYAPYLDAVAPHPVTMG